MHRVNLQIQRVFFKVQCPLVVDNRKLTLDADYMDTKYF